MAFSPLQKSFNAGEISNKLRGQFGTSVYERGLDTDENFIPTPQGSLLMRAGGQDAGDLAVATKPRFIPFRVSGSVSDYVLAFTNSKLEIYSRSTGARVGIPAVMYAERFDLSGDGLGAWNHAPRSAVDFAWDSGGGYGTAKKVEASAGAYLYFQAGVNALPTFIVGHTYTVKIRQKASGAVLNIDSHLTVYDAAGGVSDYDFALDTTASWSTQVATFEATRTDHLLQYAVAATGNFWIDYILIIDETAAAVTSLVSPYTTTQLPLVQHDAELVRNRIILAHPDVYPQVVALEDGVWSIRNIPFTSPPAAWASGNYPAAVEVGFQGRLWFGGTYAEPHTVWYSKSGEPFNFTVGTNPADSNSFIVSTKGAIRWLKGQHRLFAGAETVEHSIMGSNKIIAPNDVNVDDQSAFGSGAVQGIHIGDQVLWVTRSLRSVRAMNYEQKEDSWLSVALTFVCEGMIPNVGIREIHFCRDPIPTLFIVSNDDRLFAATYDRSVEVIAFYRIVLAGNASVATACVADGPEGSELWYSPLRSGTYRVERIAMHEDGVDYLDSWRQVAADANGVMTGLAQFNGQTITVKYTDDESHVVTAQAQVVGGTATVADAAGQTVTVGLAFTAQAVTLPLALKDKRGRYSKIGALISDSALPKINGWTPQNDKLGDEPQGLPQTLRSGKFSASNEGTDDEAKITITQDLPFRTEILALYGVAEG